MYNLSSIVAVAAALTCLPAKAEKKPWKNLQQCTVKVLVMSDVGLIKMEKQSGKYIMFAAPGIGHGSGVIWKVDKQGTFVITNKHVVDGAFAVAVGVQGIDELFPARVVHASSTQDLALVLIDTNIPKSLCNPVFKSSKASLGDGVKVFGYAVDATADEAKMSAGIISRQAGDLIEIDAAVNPGNSGGPAFDDSGKLIGIAVAKLKDTEGMNYVIPKAKVDSLLLAVQNTEIQRWIDIRASKYWDVYGDVCRGLKHISLSTYTPEELVHKTLSKDFIEVAEAVQSWVEAKGADFGQYEMPEIMVLAAGVLFNDVSMDVLEAKMTSDQAAVKQAKVRFGTVGKMVNEALEEHDNLAQWSFVKHLLTLKLAGITIKEVGPEPPPSKPPAK